jgi:DNA-binding CsgD family transcriptional regulator
MSDSRGTAVPLTKRQREVLERLDRRLPIKVIAAELGVSPSRVNQHIAALKRLTGANDLAELVAQYRAGKFPPDKPPCIKVTWTKSQLPERGDLPSTAGRTTDGEIVLADSEPIFIDAPWADFHKPSLVRRMLDGSHSVIRRLTMMLGLAAAIAAAILVTISAATELGRLIDGVAYVPVDSTENGRLSPGRGELIMSERLNDDARFIKKLMREAEGVTNEAMIACSKLKQAMILARSLPEFDVATGQAAVMKLTRAEQNFVAAYSDLLRVHSELSDIATETAAMDEDIPTKIKGHATADDRPVLQHA